MTARSTAAAIVRRRNRATEHDEAVLGESGLAARVFDAAGLAAGPIGVLIPSSD